MIETWILFTPAQIKVADLIDKMGLANEGIKHFGSSTQDQLAPGKLALGQKQSEFPGKYQETAK